MAGMAPGPRASFNMVGHRQRAVLFGGIKDQPGKVSDLSCLRRHIDRRCMRHNLGTHWPDALRQCATNA